MQTPDDEQFETYLRRFQPVAPKPLPALRVVAAPRRFFAPAAWFAAAAAILIVGMLMFQARKSGVEQSAPLEPLTIRSANTWLAAAPSFQAAVDDLAFRSKSNSIPQGRQSAIAVLSEDKNKL